MKKISLISIAIAVLLATAIISQSEAAIDLAPVAEGTSGTHFVLKSISTSSSYSFSSTSSTAVYSSINGVPNYTTHTSSSSNVNLGPFIHAGRYITSYTTTSSSTTTSVFNHFNLKGIIEFDISSLSSLSGPFTASLTLDFHKLNISTNIPTTLSLFDMAEATENGAVTGVETKGSKIADIFAIPVLGSPSPGFYSFDVTSALTADLANIGTNSYSGFVIDYDVPDPAFPMDQFSDVLGEVDFNNYDAGAGEGPKLTINTSPVPEPTSLMLLGSGLIGVYFIRRKFK